MNPIYTLKELGLQDASRVGEEAASLGEILKIGAPVPATFVVPTTSYAEYLNYPTVKSTLAECDPSNPEELKTQLLAISLPKILERSLRSSYRILSGPRDTFVVVRTGTGEEHGLGEEELIHSVKKLWAEHLVRLYSFQKTPSHNPLPILIQQMEVREIEGRLFTSDPYSSDLGTAVVEVNHRDGFKASTEPSRTSKLHAKGRAGTINGSAELTIFKRQRENEFEQSEDCTSGKERFFFEKGTDRLTKRIVTGTVEEEASLELASSLSSWATKIEKLLGGPQELGWSSYRGVLSFLRIGPLHIKERVPVATKLWVKVDGPKEAIPGEAEGLALLALSAVEGSEVEGMITTTADNAVRLAKKFPTKPVLLALETVDADELALVRRARHKERRKNLHLILPSVRTVDGLRGMKRGVAGEGLARGPHLKFYFRAAFPANVVLLDRFLELGMDGVVFDAGRLSRGFLGLSEAGSADTSPASSTPGSSTRRVEEIPPGKHPVFLYQHRVLKRRVSSAEPDDSLLWALGEVQRGCKKAGLDLLYLSDRFDEELIANLLRRGVTRIVADAADEKTLLSTLTIVEGRILDESDHA